MDANHKMKLKLGRKVAYLRRCIIVAELLNKHENATTIRLRVFNEHVKPVIGCSYAQFNNMLNEPNPQRQIEQIEEQLSNL